jgi:bacterioferritin-associated ferredoxin
MDEAVLASIRRMIGEYEAAEQNFLGQANQCAGAREALRRLLEESTPCIPNDKPSVSRPTPAETPSGTAAR